ncbi:hypothetical protein N7523_005783 [Penicillium sp. IBT 18751x]|nr:hypothetical protein N7523_005626 [Penicillium sp. IBT 18751x]KAJ6118032.1 hypothetical protein N7523_005783 [Penicillium sp. IBT 18751x]
MSLFQPPVWTPLSEPTQLREDSGQYYRDANAARYPTYPLEPMIQAILTERPEFSLNYGPVFQDACRVVGNTVFFIRREVSPTEAIPDVRGYGHTFPEAYTTWTASVQGSESHQRLVNYEFDGMNCIVRFEVDGFLPDMIVEDLKVQKDQTSKTGDGKVDDLVSSIQGRGRYIPQRAVFDLKTRSIKRMDIRTVEEELPRLWIRQISNFVLAYHTFGKFNDIRVQDVREELKRWEESQQSALVRFASLLHMVVSFSRSADNGKFEIEHEEGEKVLNFREPGGIVNSVLPTSLASKWGFEDASEANS